MKTIIQTVNRSNALVIFAWILCSLSLHGQEYVKDTIYICFETSPDSKNEVIVGDSYIRFVMFPYYKGDLPDRMIFDETKHRKKKVPYSNIQQKLITKESANAMVGAYFKQREKEFVEWAIRNSELSVELARLYAKARTRLHYFNFKRYYKVIYLYDLKAEILYEIDWDTLPPGTIDT